MISMYRQLECREIPEYAGLAIHPTGRVFKLRPDADCAPGTGKPWAEIVAEDHVSGHREITYRPDGKLVHVRLNKLVALAFCAKAEGRDYIRHVDGNSRNCDASNLTWAARPSALEQTQDGEAFDRELSRDDILGIRANRYSLTREKLAEVYGVSRQMIVFVQLRQRYGHVK